MIFDRRILGACAVASKDKARHVLRALKFTDDNKVVSTDGYMIIKVNLPEQKDQTQLVEEKDRATFSGQLVEASVVEKTAKQLNRAISAWEIQKKAVIFDDVKTKRITIKRSDFGETTFIETNAIDSEFPDTDTIIKSNNQENTKSATFDIKFLTKILNGMRLAGCSRVKLSIGEPLIPMKIVGKDWEQKEVLGIVMPMRVSEGE